VILRIAPTLDKPECGSVHPDSDLHVLVRLRPGHEDLADDREGREVGVSVAPIHIGGITPRVTASGTRRSSRKCLPLCVIRTRPRRAANVAWKPSSLPALRASCVVTTLTSTDRSQLIAHAEISSSAYRRSRRGLVNHRRRSISLRRLRLSGIQRWKQTHARPRAGGKTHVPGFVPRRYSSQSANRLCKC
jgi:hypothetical protein